MNILAKSLPKLALAAMLPLLLAACATQPYGDNGYRNGGGYRSDGGYRNGCQCGVVQDVQQIYVEQRNESGALGAVIGALAGGVLGSTIGKGDGRTAAAVGGAVAGGFVGNRVGQANGGQDVAYRVRIRMDDGQDALVTQRADPQLRRGDYVEIRGSQVYRR